jgi:hypothetical protein
MKKPLFALAALFISLSVFCQTPVSSFHCVVKKQQPISQTVISNEISKIDLENYRLLHKSTTLSFDNGFDIILVPAADALSNGTIKATRDYPENFGAKFKLPVFHLNPDGKVSAAYPVINSKYSTQKKK